MEGNIWYGDVSRAAGKSLSKEMDPERGLSEEGVRDVERIADVAKNYEVPVSQIKHSGKKRALQTAEILASALNPRFGVDSIDGIHPMDDAAVFAKEVGSEEEVMLVGHLPFLEKLTSYLVTGSLEIPVFKFQNGGIVCLERYTDTGRWVIKWTLMPKIG